MSWVDNVVTFEFFLAFAAIPVFIGIYLTTRWYRTWEGRAIMAQKLLFAGFLINGILYFTVGSDYPGRELYRLILFTAMPLVFWGMTALLIRTRLQSHRARRSQPQSSELASSSSESHPGRP